MATAIIFKENVCVCVCMGAQPWCTNCCLVPLTEGGATVWAPSLTQCKAEEEAQGEEDDGTQDSQASEVILQDSNSATHRHR